jgi:hypothetical protein
MPRYRFSWSNIDVALLHALCAETRLDLDDPAASLKSEFGARPKDEFVDRCWSVLRDRWLADDSRARKSIAASLRERNYGTAGEPDDMELIRSCRNSKGLRQIVLPEFIALGETGSQVKPRPSTHEPSRVSALEGFGGRNRIGAGEPRQDDRVGDATSRASDRTDETGSTDEDELYFAPDDDEVPNAVDHLRAWMQAVLRATGKEDLVVDEDTGDALLTEGSALVIVSVDKDPLLVEILAIVLKDIDASDALLRHLNDVNESIPGVSIYHVGEDRTIYMRTQLLADGLTVTHFIHHLVNLSVYADSLDHELQREFGGRTAADLMKERSDVQWV